MIVTRAFKYRMSSTRDGEKALGITTYVIPRGPLPEEYKKSQGTFFVDLQKFLLLKNPIL